MCSGEVWVFGYGALIWDRSGISFIEEKIGELEGWHRDWTWISTRRHGAPTCSLQPGGKVKGIFLRLDPKTKESGLEILRTREVRSSEEVVENVSGISGKIYFWKMGNNLTRYSDTRGLMGVEIYKALATRAKKIKSRGSDGKTAEEYALAVHRFDPDDEITAMYVNELKKLSKNEREQDLARTVDSLPLVYIRHKMDSNPKIYRQLIERKWIAIHYERDLISRNRRSTNPDDYVGRGKKALKRLWRYCKAGALVAADYSKYAPAKMLVGILPPNSKPIGEIFPPCEPREGAQEAEVDKLHYPDGVAYKVVKLVRPREFKYAEHRVLQGLQPRGGGVLVRWKKGEIEPYLKALYKRSLGLDVKIPRSVYMLTSAQSEVLCSEYLRRVAPLKMRIDYFLTPVGRGMKGTDIDGASKNVRVLGQVSFSSDNDEIGKKIRDLRSHAEEYTASKKLVLVYFGPKKCKPPKSQLQGVEYVPIEEVFNKLRGSGILEDMLP